LTISVESKITTRSTWPGVVREITWPAKKEKIMLAADAKGAELAQEIGDRAFEAHRGVFFVRAADPMWVRKAAEPGDVVAFGNDGYHSGERAKREVAAVWCWAQAHDLHTIHFGVDSEVGYSWAIVLRLDECHDVLLTETGRERLRREVVDVLWRAFLGDDDHWKRDPIGFRRLQEVIAEAAIARALKAGDRKCYTPWGIPYRGVYLS
jgi:hypothetical protein